MVKAEQGACVGRFVARVAMLIAALLVAALMAFVLTGCASTELSGTVRFGLEDAPPVAGAVVVLGDQEATTDASGNFVFEDRVRSSVTEGRVVIDGFPDYALTLDLTEVEDEHSISIEIPAVQITFELFENSHGEEEVFSDDVTVIFNGAPLMASVINTTTLQEGFVSDIVAPDVMNTLRIESEKYELHESEFGLGPGDAISEVSLDLTLEETYRRFNRTNALHRYTESYEYLHPDMRALVSLSEWTSAHNPRANVIDAAPDGYEMVAEWTSEFANQTYHNVAEIQRSFITEYGDSRRARTETQRWIEIDGRWFILFARQP